MRGIINNCVQTYEDMGFPGSPIMGVLCKSPAKVGFPGRTLTFWKKILKPISFAASFTKSYLPTDAPPIVIIISENFNDSNNFLFID